METLENLIHLPTALSQLRLEKLMSITSYYTREPAYLVRCLIQIKCSTLPHGFHILKTQTLRTLQIVYQPCTINCNLKNLQDFWDMFQDFNLHWISILGKPSATKNPKDFPWRGFFTEESEESLPKVSVRIRSVFGDFAKLWSCKWKSVKFDSSLIDNINTVHLMLCLWSVSNGSFTCQEKGAFGCSTLCF